MKNKFLKFIKISPQAFAIFSLLFFVSSCKHDKDDDTKKMKEYNVFIPASSVKMSWNLNSGKTAIATITDSSGNSIPEVVMKPVGEKETCWKCKNGNIDCVEIPCPIIKDPCKEIYCGPLSTIAQDHFNPKEKAIYHYFLAADLKMNP